MAFARSHYQYDKVGREVATWRDEDGGKGERFSFNPTSQLTEARYDAGQVWTGNPLNATRSDSYQYTPDNLNRASLTSNGVTTNYGVSALNQYSSVNGQGVEYDIRFNLYRMSGWQYDYNAPNRLVSVTGNGHSASFTYDGLGRCVRRTVDGNTILFAYDSWKPVTEYDAAGNLSARNIYGPGADELLMRGGGYGWFFYHSDKQGSVSALVDLSGNVVERYKYDAFGAPTISDWHGNPHLDASGKPVSWVGNRFMFTGREYLAALGIYDYRNRFYHPAFGRFLQTDPTGFDGGDMNLFRYCADDPVNRTDPDGTTAIDSWKAQMLWQGSGDGTVSEQFLRMERLQAGMGDNAGGGGPRSAENEGQKGLRSDSGPNFAGRVANSVVNASQEKTGNPRYATAKQAGYASVKGIVGRSIAKKVEYAWRIFRYRDGSYSYTNPRRGGSNWSYPGRIPGGTTPAGWGHTHGHFKRGYTNEEFSEPDWNIIKSGTYGGPGYLGTTSGRVIIGYPNGRSEEILE